MWLASVQLGGGSDHCRQTKGIIIVGYFLSVVLTRQYQQPWFTLQKFCQQKQQSPPVEIQLILAKEFFCLHI